MTGQVILINGGSSSGKSSIARELQAILPDPWLAFGIDDFVDALPRRLTESNGLTDSSGGIEFGQDGKIDVGPEFSRLESLWRTGIGAMTRAGAKIIIDDVFLGGPHSQRRWRTTLSDLTVLWVGVRCDPEVAAARERARGDRPVGMAREQAVLVHRDVDYDLEVDTTELTIADAAAVVRSALHR